jgi:ferredoxin
MSTKDKTLFEAFVNQHDDRLWAEVIRALLPSIHEVDKTATQIWFSFFPLALLRALQQAEDPEQLAKDLQLLGTYYLKDQIDSSHDFMYGHRYWPDVKKAVADHAISTQAPASLDLADQIREVAGVIAKRTKVEESLLSGITAVAFMTLQHVGLAAFTAAPGIVRKLTQKSPEQVLNSRARDDSQGLFGFLRGDKKIYTITFNEQEEQAKFKLITTQEMTTAAATDKRDYHARDSRCVAGEGPIPVQCRSAACGTCWVGVLGGAEKLSDVGALESRRIKEFGYIETDEPKPLVRLACQAQATGAISIVIPPWNGVFGKYLRAQKQDKAEAQQATRF